MLLALNTLLHFVVVLLFQPSGLSIFAEKLPYLNFFSSHSPIRSGYFLAVYLAVPE